MASKLEQISIISLKIMELKGVNTPQYHKIINSTFNFRGEVWPKPKVQKLEDGFLVLRESNFQFEVCKISTFVFLI